jgi:hypothetical protein
MRLRSCAWGCFFAAVLTTALVTSSAFVPVAAAQNKKPSISVRASPPVGFPPLRVVVTAEIKGGANDFQDFYCASVEWDWGDGTKSQSQIDCDPYEAGKSEIKRRYVEEHTFRGTGMTTTAIDPTGNQPPSQQYRVRFVLKQKDKTVGSGSTNVEVRSGM